MRSRTGCVVIIKGTPPNVDIGKILHAALSFNFAVLISSEKIFPQN